MICLIAIRGLGLVAFPVSKDGQEPCCISIYPRTQFDSLSTVQLGDEYRRLKKKHCGNCDKFSSDYAEIMRLLGEKLAGRSEKEILRVMGKPDERREKSIIYHWRARHDYLIFVFGDDGSAVSSWYHAYE